MSEFVKLVIVDGTKAPFASNLQAVTLGGVVYPLPNPVPAGSSNVRNDLSQLAGLPAGAQIQIRVSANGGATSTSTKILTYSDGSAKATYFEISGSAGAPVITFIKIE